MPMLEWLLGKKKRKVELPLYAALRRAGLHPPRSPRGRMTRHSRPGKGRLSAVSIDRAMMAGDTLNIWAVFKSTELARADLYIEFALIEARAGWLEVAREVALEPVDHVTLENPRPHLLLGLVGVKLGDGGWCGRLRRT